MDGGRTGVIRTARDDQTKDRTLRGLAGWPAFALLAETLLTGAVVAVVSIPLVTALPAVAAGVGHLRRHVAGTGDSFGSFLHDIAAATRELWRTGAAVVGLLLLLRFDLWLSGTGALPGARVVAGVSATVAAGVIVVALRLAAAWGTANDRDTDLRTAARRSAADPGGTLLLAGAIVMCVALVWMLLPMLLVVGGLLALAALAVESRGVVGGREAGSTKRGEA